MPCNPYRQQSRLKAQIEEHRASLLGCRSLWLGKLANVNPHIGGFAEYIATIRAELDNREKPLAEALALFTEAQQKIEAWEISDTEGTISGPIYRRMLIPRLSDWLSPRTVPAQPEEEP